MVRVLCYGHKSCKFDSYTRLIFLLLITIDRNNLRRMQEKIKWNFILPPVLNIRPSLLFWKTLKKSKIS